MSAQRERERSLWWRVILEGIADKDLSCSGFSEYETYGNFIALHFPHKFKIRNLKKTRHGTFLLGDTPNLSVLKFLGLFFDCMSFERWEQKCRFTPLRYLKIFQEIVKSIRGD